MNEQDIFTFRQCMGFRQCEAATLAKINRTFEATPKSNAQLVGEYVHKYFQNDRDFHQFEIDHPEMISSRGATKGYLKAEFRQANQMIDALKADPHFAQMHRRASNSFVVGELFNYPFGVSIDCLNRDKGYLIDIVTTRRPIQATEFHQFAKKRLDVFDRYHLPLKMGIIQQVMLDSFGETYDPYIFLVTKETPPATVGVALKPLDWVFDLEVLHEQLPRFAALKRGDVKPTACGVCEYCRTHPTYDGLVSLSDLK
jgi:hypothetical protein